MLPDELIQQKSKDNDLKLELVGQMLAAKNMAEWLFFDVFYNCDSNAYQRSDIRLREMHEQFGPNVMFGIAGYWAMRCYWQLNDAYRSKGIVKRPDLLPNDVTKLAESSSSDEKKRAFVSAQQFVATITHTNSLMAKAIFDVVYDAGIDDLVEMMKFILTLAIHCQHAAEKISMSY